MIVRALAWLGTGLLLAGCIADRPTPVEAGRSAFAAYCVDCHGSAARGDGPMAVFVTGGVPNLRELSLRNGGAFPKTRVIKVITRISDLHEDLVAMPDFGTLLQAEPGLYVTEKGEMIQTDATILAIVDYLQSIQEQGEQSTPQAALPG